MPHTHEIIDKDNRFVIDPITRTISNESDKTKLVQYDHNSERFTFQCPRMIEGHDMSLSTSVRVQYININKKTREASSGVYAVDDIEASLDDPDTVVFSWLISRNATKFVGTLSFLVEFICTEDNSNIIYAWHTDIYKYIAVDTGMDNGEIIEEKYPDILEKWKNEILAEIPTIDPHPVTRIESLDKSNMVNLRDLDSGAYVLYGYFRPYKGSTVTMAFGSNLSVSIVKKTSESYAQIFYPVNNCVQYLRMTDSDYERKNVYLSDVADSAAKIGDLSNLTTEAKDNLVEAINSVGHADAVLYTEQELSEAQQAQARANIMAGVRLFYGSDEVIAEGVALDDGYGFKDVVVFPRTLVPAMGDWWDGNGKYKIVKDSKNLSFMLKESADGTGLEVSVSSISRISASAKVVDCIKLFPGCWKATIKIVASNLVNDYSEDYILGAQLFANGDASIPFPLLPDRMVYASTSNASSIPESARKLMMTKGRAGYVDGEITIARSDSDLREAMLKRRRVIVLNYSDKKADVLFANDTRNPSGAYVVTSGIAIKDGKIGTFEIAVNSNSASYLSVNVDISESGAVPLVVTITEATDTDGNTTYSADHTFAEIQVAIQAGQNVYAVYQNTAFQLRHINSGSVGFGVTDKFGVFNVYITSDDSVDITNERIDALPDATAENAGKYLKVVGSDDDGYWWDAVDAPGGAADWSQNDETAKDYIKNRTHYIETDVENVLLQESSFTGDELTSPGYVFYLHAFDFTSDMPGEGNVKIKVKYDGTVYTFDTTNEDNIISVGNVSIKPPSGTDTGEPFFIEISERTVSGNIIKGITVFAKESGEHTVSVSYISDIVHYLDPKYIKDMYHSGIGEGVIGTGFKGWLAVTNYSAITIPKMAIKGIVYENIPVDSTTTSSVIYVVGGYSLSFNRRDGVMNAMPQDISDSDVEFFGNTMVDYPVPDKYIPDWVASKTDIPDISGIKQPVQSNVTETDKTSLAYIRNKKLIFTFGFASTSSIAVKDYASDFTGGIIVYFGDDKTTQMQLSSVTDVTGVVMNIKSCNTGLNITDDERPYGVMIIAVGDGSLRGAICINPRKTIPVDNTTIKLNDQGQLTLALSNANGVSF